MVTMVSGQRLCLSVKVAALVTALLLLLREGAICKESLECHDEDLLSDRVQ